ncbi:hypothetical protein [Bacillus safensis]|uniref:hypothetical protein n=1 Tax=Bacillus safensis TaxID=561879 RepID=UPI000B44AC26|nr:hypothetical protein [Bacillus safensis]MCY7492899.1 hypothetical protein [Bacillus safensis]MED4993221.1 hypothetical protein [Bacillus safensis]UDB49130.1 hypothetical protein B0X07_08510 [Bacillus safensis]
MKTLNNHFNDEVEKINSLEGVNHQFLSINLTAINDIFGYIFSLNYLKNKAETKNYFGSEFEMTFSLLLESFYALITGQCRSALLLLRAAQEANFKFVLEKERGVMLNDDPTLEFKKLNFRFSETKTQFIKDLKKCLDENEFSEYYRSVERNLTLYNRLSVVSHSVPKSTPITNVEYFSSLHNDTIIDKDEYFKLFHDVFDNIFLLNYFLIRESLINWDSYILQDLLRIMYGKKRTNSLIKIVKKDKISS